LAYSKSLCLPCQTRFISFAKTVVIYQVCAGYNSSKNKKKHDFKRGINLLKIEKEPDIILPKREA